MSEPDMTPLCEASCEDISLELMRRFDSLVIAYETVAPDTTKERVFNYSFHGGRAAALGLCEMTRWRLVTWQDDVEDDG